MATATRRLSEPSEQSKLCPYKNKYKALINHILWNIDLLFKPLHCALGKDVMLVLAHCSTPSLGPNVPYIYLFSIPVFFCKVRNVNNSSNCTKALLGVPICEIIHGVNLVQILMIIVEF